MLALARATLAMGAFVALGALWCLFWVPRDSGAFVIAVATVIIGGSVVAVSVVLARRELRRDPRVSTSPQSHTWRSLDREIPARPTADRRTSNQEDQ